MRFARKSCERKILLSLGGIHLFRGTTNRSLDPTFDYLQVVFGYGVRKCPLRGIAASIHRKF
jgi:hypothetical protein